MSIEEEFFSRDARRAGDAAEQIAATFAKSQIRQFLAVCMHGPNVLPPLPDAVTTLYVSFLAVIAGHMAGTIGPKATIDVLRQVVKCAEENTRAN